MSERFPPAEFRLHGQSCTYANRGLVFQTRWAYGDSLPASALDEAIANKTLFQDFWQSHVLPVGNNDSAYCSDSIILYSAGVNILYRNTFLE